MGLTQCVMCVFLPLWTNQFAPKDRKTSWMGYLQVGFNCAIVLCRSYMIKVYVSAICQIFSGISALRGYDGLHYSFSYH